MKRVGGILLAAGSSQRMNQPKLLLAVKGRTILEMSIRNLLASQLSFVCAVIPGWDGRFQSILREQSVERLHLLTIDQPCPMSESLKTGWKWLVRNTDVEAIMISLGDMPLVGHHLIDHLVEIYLRSSCDICVPFHKGRRGHPVIISCKLTPEVLRIQGDKGARDVALAPSDSLERVDVDDDAVIFDIDTQEDFKELKVRLGSNG